MNQRTNENHLLSHPLSYDCPQNYNIARTPIPTPPHRRRIPQQVSGGYKALGKPPRGCFSAFKTATRRKLSTFCENGDSLVGVNVTTNCGKEAWQLQQKQTVWRKCCNLIKLMLNLWVVITRDLKFVKKFTRPNSRGKEFYTLKTRISRVFSPAINSENASLSVIWPSFC